MHSTVVRRRSPMWVRQLSSETLHGMAGRFRRQRFSEGITDAQEWLWDALISELEYRHRSQRPAWQRCSCELCVPPFEE